MPQEKEYLDSKQRRAATYPLWPEGPLTEWIDEYVFYVNRPRTPRWVELMAALKGMEPENKAKLIKVACIPAGHRIENGTCTICKLPEDILTEKSGE